ncbi:hypothetical protein CN507_20895 [Bacillus cereus]|nr:hypothetical protein CN507_20895 [Bacillus cereus]
MYSITNGLKYDESLVLNPKYRYDFVSINYQADFGYESIFVFRTIKEGNGMGNVLIDLINESNINAISTNLHGDCHFHIFKSIDLAKVKSIEITEKISLEKIKSTSSDEYYAILQEQKYKLNNGVSVEGSDCIHLPVFKYLLLTQYHHPVVNMNSTNLAPIFQLQKEDIWHNNRCFNFNDISRLDVDKVGYELDPSTPWREIKKIIEEKKEEWIKKSYKKSDQISKLRQLQKYIPVE